MNGFVNFGGILAGRVMSERVSGLFFSIFLELPVVRAVLKSLHQVHIRKGLSAAGFIRLRSLLAVMCKSERKKKIVGTFDHKYLWSSRNEYAQHLTYVQLSSQIWLSQVILGLQSQLADTLLIWAGLAECHWNVTNSTNKLSIHSLRLSGPEGKLGRLTLLKVKVMQPVWVCCCLQNLITCVTKILGRVERNTELRGKAPREAPF